MAPSNRLLLLLMAAPSIARAGGWDWAGDSGAFGSAKAACEDMIGKTSYVFGALKPVENEEQRKRGWKACYSKYGGGGDDSSKKDSEPELVYVGVVYPTEPPPEPPPDSSAGESGGNAAGPPPASKGSSGKGAPQKCGAKTDLSWFPSIQKSALSTSGSAVVPDTKAGSCFVRSGAAGSHIFAKSKGAVRPDRMKKQAKPIGEHYFLQHHDQIIDPTLFQFFLVEPSFPGLVFAGTASQLQETLQKLYDLCGPNPATTDGKSGADIYQSDFAGAAVCNPGSTLQMKPSGTQGYYRDEPKCAPP